MINFTCKKFDDLGPQELYEAMALRQEVFIVEQNCPYLDADGKDQPCRHLLGRNAAGKLVAYTRLMPPGVAYEKHPSIGRVVTSPGARGTGAGKELMQASIGWMEKLWPGLPIKIGAQAYLQKFYEGFGFEICGEGYLEDGIPHFPMVRGVR